MSTVWIVPHSIKSSLPLNVISQHNHHVLTSSNATNTSSGSIVINASQWTNTHHACHAILVIRVMVMVVVWNVILVKCVVQTHHPQQHLIAVNVLLMGMDVGSVQKDM